MSRLGRGMVMMFLGAFTLRLVLTGGFGWFVQQRMRIPLAAAAILLLAFGIHEFVAIGRDGFRRPDPDPGPDHDHDHDDYEQFWGENGGRTHSTQHHASAGPRVGWLLLLPLLVLVSIAPTGLGSAAAQRVDAYVPVEATREFVPLDQLDEPQQPGLGSRLGPDQPGAVGDDDSSVDGAQPSDVNPGSPTDELRQPSLLESVEGSALNDNSAGAPVTMRVYDFLDRAIWDTNRSLEGRVVRLEGLVVNDPMVPDGFKLTRFLVSCCAADGIPLQVSVRGVDRPLADDTWVVADIIWRPPESPYQEGEQPWIVEADAVVITPVIGGPPKDPYESPY